MKLPEARDYERHKKRHAPNLNGTTVQEARDAIALIESNLRSPLRNQMDKDALHRSNIDAQVAIEHYKKYIKRLTT